MLIVRCTRNQMSRIYTTKHGKASPFQPWWSVRGAIRTYDVNRCSLPGCTFCFCLLRLGLAVTGSSGWKRRNADTRCEAESDFYLRLPVRNVPLTHFMYAITRHKATRKRYLICRLDCAFLTSAGGGLNQACGAMVWCTSISSWYCLSLKMGPYSSSFI